MDQDNIQDIIKERMKEIPPEVQKAIADGNLPQKFDQISKKFSLRIDQSGSLQTETLLLMLGLESGSDFVDNLMKEAEMSREIATAVAAEVNTTILRDIHEALRAMEEIAEAEEAQAEKDGGQDSKTETAGNTAPQFTKEDVLKGIEDPSVHANVPINLIQTLPVVQVAPAAAPQAPAFMSAILNAPSVSPTETIQKKPGIDPYRESIE
jgi:hypothetical protein